MPTPFSTHQVTNQSPPLVDVDLLATDAPLMEAIRREGGSSIDMAALKAYALLCGSAEMAEQAWLANDCPPRLETHDARGNRQDTIIYHPAYHALMQASIGVGLGSGTWAHLASADQAPAPARHVLRAAQLYLATQMEPGHCCPITMTHASVAALLEAPELAEAWVPRILARHYDSRSIPAPEKRGSTLGMAMTEKQGGTDVRAGTTRAEPTGDTASGEHVLTGHKWFMSAPMSDAFLVLAQADAGLTCFLMPRFLPDGTLNAVRLQRLKDKIGNRSNASSEIELQRAHAWRVGEPGRGVATIIGMVTQTRLDCAIASAGLMRQALTQAIHHARHRKVFGRTLVEQAVMTEVLADMALDVEAATALVFRLARAFDRADDDRARAFTRLMTPVVKYWVTKLAPPLVTEAMECLGGNGYVEPAITARLFREAPVNAIWEGSGNVMALDILRVLQREPEAAPMVIEDLAEVARHDPHLKAGIERVEAILHDPRTLDRRVREFMETLAVVAAGVVLRSHAPAHVADAFAFSRLSGHPRATYGQGIAWTDAKALVDRALAGL